jgi:hypothetical protein
MLYKKLLQILVSKVDTKLLKAETKKEQLSGCGAIIGNNDFCTQLYTLHSTVNFKKKRSKITALLSA